jgi:hypothetical protein
VDRGWNAVCFLCVVYIRCLCFQIRKKGSVAEADQIDQDNDPDAPDWLWLEKENIPQQHFEGDVSDDVCREVLALCLDSQVRQQALQFCPPSTIGVALAWVCMCCILDLSHLL